MKTSLTKEQHEKLQKLGVECVSANDIAFLLGLIPPLRGKFTIMRDNGKWKVGSLYSQSISFSETNAVWKSKIEKEELIDALFEFVVRFVKTEKK